MKRVKCPRCDEYITFDETQYTQGQSLVFQCPSCKKQFSIRIGVSRLRPTVREEATSNSKAGSPCGSLTVIENVFHYRQELPLRIGDNVIGRYIQGTSINTPIETSDPSVDTRHCIISVRRGQGGKLRYTLRDAPSNTGTVCEGEMLRGLDRLDIDDGSVITIGATTMILHTADAEAN